MLLHYTLHHFQSKPGTFTELFCCKERVEYARLHILRYTRAIVDNGHFYRFTVLMRFDGKDAFSVWLHSISWIVYQVGPNLVQLAYQCFYRRYGMVKIFHNLNITFTQFIA